MDRYRVTVEGVHREPDSDAVHSWFNVIVYARTLEHAVAQAEWQIAKCDGKFFRVEALDAHKIYTPPSCPHCSRCSHRP